MLVEGASSLAKKCGISDMVIGLTIVAFGTSAPELVVNVTSSLQGATGITIGNVLGSNIANILLILGAAAVITPISVHKKFLSREVVICLAATLVFAIFINDARIDGAATSPCRDSQKRKCRHRKHDRHFPLAKILTLDRTRVGRTPFWWRTNR